MATGIGLFIFEPKTGCINNTLSLFRISTYMSRAMRKTAVCLFEI